MTGRAVAHRLDLAQGPVGDRGPVICPRGGGVQVIRQPFGSVPVGNEPPPPAGDPGDHGCFRLGSGCDPAGHRFRSGHLTAAGTPGGRSPRNGTGGAPILITIRPVDVFRSGTPTTPVIPGRVRDAPLRTGSPHRPD